MKNLSIAVVVLSLTNIISVVFIGLGATGTLTMPMVYEFIGYEVETVEESKPYILDTNWTFYANDTIHGVNITIEIYRGNGSICWANGTSSWYIITNHYFSHRLHSGAGCFKMFNQGINLAIMIGNASYFEGKYYYGVKI